MMFRIRTALATGLVVVFVTYGADLLLVSTFHLHDPWSDRILAAIAGLLSFILATLWKLTVPTHAQMIERKLDIIRDVDDKIRNELNVISLVHTDKRTDRAVRAIVNELDRLNVTHEVSATLYAVIQQWLRGRAGERKNGD